MSDRISGAAAAVMPDLILFDMLMNKGVLRMNKHFI
jgi:hypothetical protein